MNLKLSHINIKGLTTDALYEDMRVRMAASNGAPVLYPYETVEALLAKIHDLGTALVATRSALRGIVGHLPQASTGSKRAKLVRNGTAIIAVIDATLDQPADALVEGDFCLLEHENDF